MSDARGTAQRTREAPPSNRRWKEAHGTAQRTREVPSSLETDGRSRHRIADARGTVINSGAARQLGASLKGGNLLSPSASVRPHLRLHHGCIGDRQRHDIIAIILMPSLRVGRRRLRCASTGGRGFSCGVVRAQGSSLLSSTPYYHLVPVLPEKVASPRISLLCLREHPRAAGWGCGWS